MLIFFDGSHSWPNAANLKIKSNIITWGIVAYHNNNRIESSGHIQINKKDKTFSGCHEIFAFIEACSIAFNNSVNPEEISFYTDDEITTNMNRSLNCWQVHPKKNDFFINAIDKIAAVIDEDKLLFSLLCLEKSRFNKVKGHKYTVDNLRVDALAKWERNKVLFNQNEFKDYETWISDGFVQYRGVERTITRWYPPFSTV